MIDIGFLISALSRNSPPVPLAGAITDVVIDSRKATAGSLFVALVGESLNGHAFVESAFENGAHYALIDQDVSSSIRVLDLRHQLDSVQINSLAPPFCLRVEDALAALQKAAGVWRAAFDMKVIGITGSVGKSTTKEVTAEVLRQRYHTHKNEGNLNNEIGLPLTLLQTPPGTQRAVLEMGFYVPGEIKLLCQLAKPSIGVITNIGTVHAERAGSMEEIARGKAELIESLPEDGTAILNFDDPMVRAMESKCKARVLFYGLDPEADLWADEISSQGLKGIHLRLNYKGEQNSVSLPMIGQHSVHTALRAAAVGLADGLNWEEIIRGLKSGKPQLRMVARQSAMGATLIDDTYNASPQSTLAALNLLADLPGRKVAVLGDMLELGQYEVSGHQQVGIRAAAVADRLITLGQRAKIIADTAIAHGMLPQHVVQLESVDAVISTLKTWLKADDSVLIKGSRGMKMDVIAPALERLE